jgi:hypothetical protein
MAHYSTSSRQESKTRRFDFIARHAFLGHLAIAHYEGAESQVTEPCALAGNKVGSEVESAQAES